MNLTALQTLVGKPYVFNANGPAAFDCWSVTAAGARQLFGFELPDLGDMLAKPEDAPACWRAMEAAGHWQVCKPQAGAVLAAYDRWGGVVHVGLFINPREVLTASVVLGTHIAQLWAIEKMMHAWEAFAWQP